ncbi:MAG: hypothetical protein E6Q97_22790 [Desulfurellales bacterium]|nr:MAG: hypothetical protein E6Q97_22790 [Desulfurellales bacterium]
MKENLPAKIFAAAVVVGMLCLIPSAVEHDRERQIERAKIDSLFQEAHRKMRELNEEFRRTDTELDTLNAVAERLLQGAKATNQILSK